MEYKKLHIEIPAEYIAFVDYCKSLGIQIYFVGGCVRDAILERAYFDFDLACIGTHKETFKQKLTSIEVLVDFDNVLIISKNIYLKEYGFESEKVFCISFNDTFEEDFDSRDFTVNSIYYDYEKQQVFGFKDSFLDLELQILNPCNLQRFKVNDLAKIRAIRISEKLDFSIDINGRREIIDCNFENINTEFQALRLRNEFTKHKVRGLIEYRLIEKIINKLNEFKVKFSKGEI